MDSSRKLITFDLDTKLLEQHYPYANWRHAYQYIRDYMIKNEFQWQQGSTYISNEIISTYKTATLLKILAQEEPYLQYCMRDCIVTNVGKQHQFTEAFKPYNEQIQQENNFSCFFNAENEEEELQYDDWDLEL